MFENTSKKISDIFKKFSFQKKITERNVEEAVEEIKIALLDADVNNRVVRRFVNSTLQEAKGEKVLKSVNPSDQFVKIVKDKITELLTGDGDNKFTFLPPDQVSVILMMGLQGSGKTTTCGKLAYKFKNEGKRVLLVPADLRRAAAVLQLNIVGGDAGVEVYNEDGQKDVNALVRNALSYAKRNQFNTMIVDTSGRLSIDEELMAELSSINNVLNPCEKLFVCDASIGQEAANVATAFDEKIGITGIIFTKFDSDTRGGAALSVVSVTKKNIKAVGVGEKKEDFEEFHPERTASRILGMGDIVSLVEKAQKALDEKEAEKLQERIEKNNFTIKDYYSQLSSISSMGGAKKVLSMIPWLSGLNPDNLQLDVFKKEKVIIDSMTEKERLNYRIIGPARRKRIAKGSGVSVNEVDKFIKKFEKTKMMLQKVSKNAKLQSAMLEKFGSMV